MVASRALFNRFVLNWFGDWSDSPFFQVSREFSARIDSENLGACRFEFCSPVRDIVFRVRVRVRL